MATHRGGAASLDGHKYFQMHPREPTRRLVREVVGCGGYDIGQLNEWLLHSLARAVVFRLRLRCQSESVQRAGGSFEMTCRQMQVSAGGSQIGMAEEQLDGAQFSAGFEQGSGERVSQRMRVDVFIDVRPLGRLPHCVEY